MIQFHKKLVNKVTKYKGINDEWLHGTLTAPLPPPLPVFALARILFCLLSFSLLSPVYTQIHYVTKRLQGKLQRCKLVHLSLTQASLLSAEASQSARHVTYFNS